MNTNLGYWIYVTHIVVSKAFNKSIHKITPELTGVQFTILIYLYYHQKNIVIQRNITDYLHLRHPTVRHIIKLMLKKKLIVTGLLPSDHRQVQVMISKQGDRLIKAHLPSINHDFNQMKRAMTNGISSQNERIFERVLKQMIKNFEE